MTAAWWQRGIIYQVYPRSFADADGDGVGDLPGLTARLDYLAGLGVDAIWLSPMYPSPMADFGYDVADYCDVDPVFGTLADFDRLLAAAGERGIRLILDLVPNHSSDEHPWFQASRSSRESPKRDWYIWRDPAPGGGPPNNWRAQFGGSAWELDERTGQYYLHLFDVKQPDLDWRNPEVRTAIYDAMRFWFQRGVAGLRIDVLWMLLKDPEYPDEPPRRAAGRGRVRLEPQRPSLLRGPAGDAGDRPRAARGRRRVLRARADRRALPAGSTGSCATTASSSTASRCRSTSG